MLKANSVTYKPEAHILSLVLVKNICASLMCPLHLKGVKGVLYLSLPTEEKKQKCLKQKNYSGREAKEDRKMYVDSLNSWATEK